MALPCRALSLPRGFMDEESLRLRLDQLSDALHRAIAADGGACALLLDPGPSGFPPEGLLGIALQNENLVAVPVPDARLRGSPMPVLVRIDTATPSGSHLLQLSLREAMDECLMAGTPGAEGRRICGWIGAVDSLPSLAKGISRRLLHRTPEGHQVLLRWTDPGVLWALWRVLRPEQRTSLLGHVGRIRLLTPGGHLECIQAEPDAADTVSALQFDARQWSELENLGPVNRALGRWASEERDAPSLEAGRVVAAAALRSARRLGFADSKDLAAFAFYALTVHPDFPAHPWVRERLARRAADDYFSAVVDDLTPVHWKRIGDDLSNSVERSDA